VNDAAAGGSPGDFGDVAIGGAEVELPLDVWIPKPVQSDDVVVEDTTVQAAIVEIEMVVAESDLPGTDSVDSGTSTFGESNCPLANGETKATGMAARAAENFMLTIRCPRKLASPDRMFR
jgi:hypothetical protein